jgi:acyl-CoA reductase-like NAD-dependent aldehyde dehydrogenase
MYVATIAPRHPIIRTILVQSAIHDRFVTKLASAVRSLKVGPGTDDTTTIGPLINAAARDSFAGWAAMDALVASKDDISAREYLVAGVLDCIVFCKLNGWGLVITW